MKRCTDGKRITDGMTMLLCTHFKEVPHNHEDQNPSERKQHLSCYYNTAKVFLSIEKGRKQAVLNLCADNCSPRLYLPPNGMSILQPTDHADPC
jgi:hypothetical protein